MSESLKNIIVPTVDSIEPKPGARERMLSNIRRKAAEPVSEDNSMDAALYEPFPALKNKVLRWALPVAVCLVIGFIGVVTIARPERPSGDVDGDVFTGQPADQVIPVKDISEFYEILGIRIAAPPEAKDENCYLINGNVAEISFVYRGQAFSLRASKQTDGFSGISVPETEVKIIDKENGATLMTYRSGTEINQTIRWTDGTTIYMLTVMADGHEDDLVQIYQLTK